MDYVFFLSSSFPHSNSAWYHYTGVGYQLSQGTDCNASLVCMKIYNYAHLTSFQGQMEVISLVWNNNLAMHQYNWKEKKLAPFAYLSPCRKCAACWQLKKVERIPVISFVWVDLCRCCAWARVCACVSYVYLSSSLGLQCSVVPACICLVNTPINTHAYCFHNQITWKPY